MKMNRGKRIGISSTRVLLMLAVLGAVAFVVLTLWERDIQSERNPRASRFAKEIKRGSSVDEAVALAHSEGANVAFVGGNLVVVFPRELLVEADVVAGKVVSATVVRRD